VCGVADRERHAHNQRHDTQTDAVLDAVAANLGVTKQEILNPEDGNMSTRVAIAETRIISETKAYLKNVRLQSIYINVML
jgi:hypothetical protein